MKKNLTPMKVLVSLILFCMVFPLMTTAQTFVKVPAVAFSQEDLDALKKNIKREPWKSAYNSLASDYRSQLNYAMQGPRETVSRAPDMNRNIWQNDMVAVHNLAWMWHFTGNEDYAKKAIDILERWAVEHKKYGGDESFLDLGDFAEYYTVGAALLKNTYPGWTKENGKHIDDYFINVLWPEADVPNPVRGLNQGAIQLKIAVGIASYLGDEERWKQAMDVYRSDGCGGLANSLPNGQVGDAGRDYGHFIGQVGALSWSAEVAWKQGYDMFSELNRRLLAISEHFYGPRSNDTFIPFGGSYGFYTQYPDDVVGNGGGSGGLTANIIYNAYVNRMKMPENAISQTLSYYNWHKLDAGSFFFHKEAGADNSKATQMDPITFDGIKPANLSRIDIGDVGIKGQTVNAGGKLTMQGAGTITVPSWNTTEDAFTYAFQPIHGDAVMVARVESMESEGDIGKAIGGLMIRESLEPGAKFVTTMLNGPNNVTFTWRGATAWSKTVWNAVSPTCLSNGFISYPWWIKIERRGDRVATYHSIDGKNWSCVGIGILPIAEDAYIGIIAASCDKSALACTEYTNISVSRPDGTPYITSNLLVDVVSNTKLTFPIDTDVKAISFNAQGLPAGIKIDPQTGVISGTSSSVGQHMVLLEATNKKGTSSSLLVINVLDNKAPETPAALQATTTEGKCTLSWGGVKNATSYTVKRSLISGDSYEVIAENISATTYTDAIPYPGDNYYVVTASNGALEGLNSNQVTALFQPAIPAVPSVENRSGAVVLTWVPTTGARHYNVKRSIVSGGPFETIASELNETTYTDNTVKDGQAYYYVISSVATSESANSDEILASPGAHTYRWAPNAISGDWNDVANWEGGSVPTGFVKLLFGKSSQTRLNNNIEGLQVSAITFDNEAPAYTLYGNKIELVSELTNISGNLQSIALPITLTGEVKTNPSGTIWLRGAINGEGRIYKTGGNGCLRLTGLNTYKGGTTLNRGTIELSGEPTKYGSTLTAGNLGLGNVIIYDGVLASVNSEAWSAIENELAAPGAASVYNDIVVPEESSLLELHSASWRDVGQALNMHGKFTGKGLVKSNGHNYNGLNLYSDFSEFEGSFEVTHGSSWHRVRLNSTSSDCSKMRWIFSGNFNENFRMNGDASFQMGSIEGPGFVAGNGLDFVVGALGLDTDFSGMFNNVKLRKIGKGNLSISGTSDHSNLTTVFDGTLTMNGKFNSSPIEVMSNAILRGIGTAAATITVNSGGILCPGNDSISGALTTLKPIDMKVGSIFRVASMSNSTSKLVTNGGTITDAKIELAENQLRGYRYLIIDNTSDEPLTGKFAGLDELSLGEAGFRITYKGGDGNDIEIFDNSTAPAIIISHLTDTIHMGDAFEYQIVALNDPKGYAVEGLPTGLTFNVETGKISGKSEISGIFDVNLTTKHANGDYSATLHLVVKTSAVPAIPTGFAIAKTTGVNVTLIWDKAPSADFVTSYTVKRYDKENDEYVIDGEEISENSYTTTPLEYNNEYKFILMAVNNIGEGAATVPLAVRITTAPQVPTAPTALKAVPSEGKITLSWEEGNEVFVYNVYRAGEHAVQSAQLKNTAPGDNFVKIASVSKSPYIDTDIDNSKVYLYKLVAKNSAGEATSQQYAVMPSASAVYHWTFDAEANGYSNDVLNQKSAKLNSTKLQKEGISNGSVKLTGDSNSYVQMEKGIFNELTDFSIMFWTKIDGYGDCSRFFDFGTGQNDYFCLSSNTGSNNDAIRYEVNGKRVDTSHGVLTKNVWQHIVLTQCTGENNKKLVKIYVNGQLVKEDGSTVEKSPAQMSGDMNQNHLGKSKWSSNPNFKGSIDEFYVYNTVLDKSVIEKVYAAYAEEAPAVPTGLNATINTDDEGATQIHLAWTAVADATYKVKRSKTSGSGYETIASGLTEPTYVDESNNSGMCYYVVTAGNKTNESEPSNEVTCQLRPVGKPSAVKAMGWNKCIELTWDVLDGATFYRIKRSDVKDGPYEFVGTSKTASFKDKNLVNGQQYYYVVTGATEAGETENSAELTAIANDAYQFENLHHVDIGGVGVKGYSGVEINSIFTVYGAGADIWKGADSFGFACKEESGALNVVVRVLSMENHHGAAKAGIMVRNDLNDQSKLAMVTVTPSGTLEFGYQTEWNQTTNYGKNVVGLTFPAWLKLTRGANGNVNDFFIYYSHDGKEWLKTDNNITSIGMDDSVQIGLVALSHNNSKLMKTEFDGFSIARELPVINGTQEMKGLAYQSFYHKISCDNMPHLFEATGLPEGLELNPTSGVIFGKARVTGVYSITVKAWNAVGESEEVILTLSIEKGTQTIAFEPIPEKTYSDSKFVLDAKASSGLPLTFEFSGDDIVEWDADSLVIISTGECTVIAKQEGNDQVEAAQSISRTIKVNKGTQTISFAEISAKEMIDEDFELGVIVTSGLPITY